MSSKGFLAAAGALIAVLMGWAVLATSHSAPSPSPTPAPGGTSFDVTNAAGGLKVGDLGTTWDNAVSGSCTIWSSSATVAATSTQQVECQGDTTGRTIQRITGITRDSVCNLYNASSTVTAVGGLDVEGYSASSTSNTATQGTLVARIVNLTGTTLTWSAAATSSAKWKYVCFDPTGNAAL